MFRCGNSENPLESLFKKPSFQLYDHQNPIFKQDDSSFFSNFPSPFFDELELPLYQILPQYQQLKPATQCVLPDQAPEKETPKRKASAKLKGKASADHPIANCHVAPQRRRRTGNKDRHSKICTAQGIRDRRMRLSLQVARKFFDLQDMLGYDKASKTIEWLFNQSKKAIKDLIDEGNNNKNNIDFSISDAKSESFVSECEVLSGIEENSNNEMKEGVVPSGASPLCIKGCREKPRKNACKPSMKESREKARERAKCRTREKIMIKGIEGSGRWCKSSPNPDDLQKVGSSNGRPSDQESRPVNQERVSPYDAHYLHQSSDVGTIEKLLGNYHCSAATVSGTIDPTNNFMGFLGNWDLLSNDRMNSSQYAAITNQQVSLAGNPNSIYAGSTPDFQLFDHQYAS